MRKLENGLSELTLAFEPGFEVDGEVVCRTFQPSYVVTRDGTLIAFCQGRIRGGSDDDPKMILTSRSDDWGATWSPAKTVSGRINHYAMSAYLSDRNGCERVSVLTMVDLRVTEDIYEKDYGKMSDQTGIDIDIVGRDTPMVLYRFDSDDGGDTWTMEALVGDRTPLNHRYADGTLIMFNPIGQVHAIPEGPHRGRYVMGGPVTIVPEGEAVTNHFRNHPQSGSAVIYSDDQGDTWRTDGFITDYLANEASAVSVNHGEELLLVRRLNSLGMLEDQAPLTDMRPGPMQRVAHTSADCGKTWSQPFLVDISAVRCHGTLARVDHRLLFSIPNGPDLPDSQRQNVSDRQRGAIYFSTDQGQTWRHKIIEPGTFSYSTVRHWRTSEEGAVTLAALVAADPDDPPARKGQWQMENASRHVQLKRKLMGLDGTPPVKVVARSVKGQPAPVLRNGSLEQAGITAARVKQIESALDEWYAAAQKPTAVVIARNGVIVLAKGYGVLDGQPVGVNTPMLLHSAMKPLMGLQVAMYVDRGIVQLDEPIGNYLPEFSTAKDRRLTFRAGHVHVSGIHFPWKLAFSRLFYFRTWQESLIAHCKRDWAPGARHQYGVVGIILALRALELLSGRNYWDAMERELFAPLGIRDMLPGGTGFSAEDFARIGVLLANHGRYGGHELFSEETYQAILPTSLTPYFPDVNLEYGIGLRSYQAQFGPGSYGHGGGCGTQIIVNPEKHLVFAMVRNERGDDYKDHLANVLDRLRSRIDD